MTPSVAIAASHRQAGYDPDHGTKTRALHGTKKAFRLRDEHFHVPEPE